MSLIGLYDVDSHNYPNLTLMKISAYHKAKGDTVEFLDVSKHYHIVYVSKVFGDEYTKQLIPDQDIQCDILIKGGTGFCFTIENGKEIFNIDMHKHLGSEIDNIYPDYSLYPEFTKNRAYGFLTRGCPNNCSFCIVSKKEGVVSHRVAHITNFWKDQKYIDILDPNILACKDRLELLDELISTKAKININQGLDARFITKEVAEKLAILKPQLERVHFAFDFMKNEKRIIEGLELANKICGFNSRNATVYMLTNYDTTLNEDVYRVRMIQKAGYQPYVMVYRKGTEPKGIMDLQRWCNSRFIYRSCDLDDYVPRKRNGGLTFRELYYKDGEYKI